MSASVASKSNGIQQSSLPPSRFLPLDPRGLDIHEYMRLLKGEAVKTSDGRVELSKYTISKLEYMKFKEGSQHEHVIATIKYNATEVRLAIERTKGVGLPQDYQPKKSPIKVPSNKPTSAIDMIQNIGHQTSLHPSRVLMTFSPHLDTLNLLQLATIIEAVHDDLEERYAVHRVQCYWFAMLVMGAAMTRGGQVRSFERGRGKAETVQELPTFTSTSDLSHIPIWAPPPNEKGELVQIPDVEGGVGKYRWVRAVAISPKDIQIIAGEAERRYALVELDTNFASIAQRHAAKRIEELEEGNRKKDDEYRRIEELCSQLEAEQQAESSRH